MALSDALVSILKAASSVTSIATDQKAIAVGSIDQGVSLPCVRIATLSTDTMESLDGYEGMEMPTVDVDCGATSKTVANNLAKAVKQVLRNYKGTVGDCRIQAVHYDDCGDDELYRGQGSQQIIYVTTLTFQIQYT